MFFRMCPYLPFSARAASINIIGWQTERARRASIFSNARTPASTQTPPRTRRFAHPTGSGGLRPEMARTSHTLLYRTRARASRLPASVVLLPDRVLRQPDLPSPGRDGRFPNHPVRIAPPYPPELPGPTQVSGGGQSSFRTYLAGPAVVMVAEFGILGCEAQRSASPATKSE
jgi:hypothetical protein